MTNNKRTTPANLYSAEIYAKTKKYQKIYGFKIDKGEHDTWNNESDAFKHTFGSVDMALKGGAHLSKYIGDKHEKDGRTNMGQSAGEENMDKWNNKIGRDIEREIRKEYNPVQIIYYINTGKMDDIIAEKVVQRMRKGDLITHPNDTRKYVEPKTPWQKFDEEIRAKIHAMNESQNEKLNRIFRKSNSSKSNKSPGSGAGRWVTINGAHVYLD